MCLSPKDGLAILREPIDGNIRYAVDSSRSPLDPASLRNRPSAIAVGISECDLVRLKRDKPTDVLIGESGRGQREVQVLYSEPGGREIYLFTDNKLIRIVKPGQG